MQEQQNYIYSDNADALRQSFEDMLDEIADLRGQLSSGDVAIVELFHEANDLEAERDRWRDRYTDLKTDHDTLEQTAAHFQRQLEELSYDFLALQRAYQQIQGLLSELFDEVEDDNPFDDLHPEGTKH